MRWLLPLPWRPLLPFTVLAVLAAVVVAILRPPALPPGTLAWLTGWAAACGAWSLGHVLAACFLRGAGGEVVRPHFNLLSLTPHFATDLADAVMLSAGARAAVWTAPFLPLGVLTAVALWQRQPWAAAPLAALLLAAWPVGGAVEKLLQLLRRRPRVATDGPSLFEAPVGPLDECRALWRRFDGRAALAQAFVALTWTLALGALVYCLLDLPLKFAWEHRAEWRTPTLALFGTAAALLVFRAASHVQHRVIDSFAFVFHRCGVWIRRWRGRVDDIGLEQIETLVGRHPLLRRLEPAAQLELVSLLQPLRARPWQTLATFDSPPPFVGLVLSGRATLHRRLKSGRSERFLHIVEGDLFGAHGLVDPALGHLEVRTSTPFAAAMLPLEDFQRLVLEPLGKPAVLRYVQNHLFLQRASALCAEWRPSAIARFAELAGTASHPSGGKILVQGQEVSSLYVLYEGRARAVRNKKPVGKLNPGDFFGEISLLQTSAATADVETKDDTRCLVVNRVEFIRFISRNHHVALQLERLCSSRLGRPIFPLDAQQSFDV